MTKSEKLVRLYLKLADYLESWSHLFQIQGDLIHANCVRFFKFYSLEQTALKELKEKVKEHQTNFIKEGKALEARKNKLFQSKDISKWEIVNPVPPTEAASMLEDKELAFSWMLTKVRHTQRRTRKR